MLRRVTVVALLALLAAAPALADKVILQDGRVLEGQVLTQTEDYILLKTRFGEMKLAKSEIKEIVKQKTPEEVYQEKSAALSKDDVAGRLTLARWCGQNGLHAQARAEAAKIVASDPDNAEARAVLGHTKHEGRWVPKGGEGKEPAKENGKAGAGGTSGPAPAVRTQFRDDKDKGEYINNLWVQGKKAYDAGDVPGARRYWEIVTKHFKDTPQAALIQDLLDAKDPSKGANKEPTAPPEDSEEEMPSKKRGGGEASKGDDERGYDEMYGGGKPEPKKRPPAKGPEKGEPIAKNDPPKGGGKDDLPRPGGKDDLPQPGGKEDGAAPGKEPPKGKQPGGKEDPAPKKDPGKQPDPKGKPDPKKDPGKKPEEEKDPDKEKIKKLARYFAIERVAIGSNFTTAGTWPEIQLQFKTSVAVKFITVIWYGMTKDGKVFWAVHSFFGPDVNIVHRKVAALKPEVETKHGRIVAGRVEIYHGLFRERELLSQATFGKPAAGAKAEWWDLEDYEGHLLLYPPKTHPWESNTLKRYTSKH